MIISQDTKYNLLTNQQTVFHDLSSNNDIVIQEADKEGAIAIIHLDYYITDSNTLLEDSSTYHNSTTDMMETHLMEAENILSSITIGNEQHVSKPLPKKPLEY